MKTMQWVICPKRLIFAAAFLTLIAQERFVPLVLRFELAALGKTS
jgi:hypothetical protein